MYFKDQVFYITQNQNTYSFEVDSWDIYKDGNWIDWEPNLPDTQSFITQTISDTSAAGTASPLSIVESSYSSSTSGSLDFSFGSTDY